MLLENFQLGLEIAGVGGIGGIIVGIWRGGFATGKRKKEIDQLISDVTSIKATIQNGGLKEAIGAIQLKCAGEMADLKREVHDHVQLPSHPGVTEDIAGLRADVENLKKK